MDGVRCYGPSGLRIKSAMTVRGAGNDGVGAYPCPVDTALKPV